MKVSSFTQVRKSSITMGIVAASGLAVGASGALGQVLEEVVVTSQKRAQSLQDVPIAVTAYSGEALQQARIFNVADLSVANPSFVINIQQNKVANSPARIRGVGTTGTNPAFEGAVGLFVDGIYRSRSGMVLASFDDIGMLEILRGPQGTLFGKNASAGALVLTSNAPTFEFEAGLEANLGNYDAQKFSGYINTPVTDNFALRFSALSDTRDGFMNNPFTGRNAQNIDTQSYKLQGLYNSDSWTARLIVDYNESDEICCYTMAGRRDPVGDFQNPLDQLYSTWTSGAPFYNETGDVFERKIVNNTDSVDQSEDWGVSLDLNFDLTDNLALRSLTSYREYENEQNNGDWDFGPTDFGADYRQLYKFETFIQELNLTGTWEVGNTSVDFVLGAFYSNEDLNHIYNIGAGEFLGENWAVAFSGTGLDLLPADQLARPGAAFDNTAYDHNNEVAALFAHTTVAVTDKLSLIAGIRYSEETKELDRTNLLAGDNLEMFQYLAANHVGAMALGASFSGPSANFETEDNETTYTLGAQYFLNEDTQLYATYSKGFKAGGISLNGDAGGNLVSIVNLLDAFAGSPPTTPEEVILGPERDATYDPETVGSFELGLKMDYMESRGRLNAAMFYSEFDDIQANTFTGTQFLTYNAETAEVAGIELENTLLITENLSSIFSLTWLERAKFGDEPNDFQPNIVGREIELAPDLAAYLAFDYERSFGEDLVGYGSVSVAYTGTHELSNDVNVKEEYAVVGLTLGMLTMGEKLDVSLSCQNCLDEEYYTNAFTQPLHFNDPILVNPGAPRTYWGTVRYRFGN